LKLLSVFADDYGTQPRSGQTRSIITKGAFSINMLKIPKFTTPSLITTNLDSSSIVVLYFLSGCVP
jgi:hypothetical protein